MMVETEHTPNPNTLKFLPGKKVSDKKGVQNLLCHYIPEVKSVEAI